MTETDSPLPPQIDGEPDYQAEIARLDTEVKAVIESLKSMTVPAPEAPLGDPAMDELIASLRELLPDDVAAKAPPGATKLDAAMWHVARAAEIAKRPKVPATDTTKPALGSVEPDFSTLPAHVRMARGYRA